MTTPAPAHLLLPRDPWGVRCYVSGASAPADIRGLTRFSVPIGVSLSELSASGLAELLAAAAIPMQHAFVDSGAFSEVEIVGNLRAVRPAAAHLLGVGPRSPRLPALLDVFRRLSPATELSTDSNALSALVGRSNGPGGAPRTLTAWQDYFEAEGSEKAREDAVAMVFGPSRILWAAMGAQVEQGLRSPPVAAPLQLGLFDGRTANT